MKADLAFFKFRVPLLHPFTTSFGTQIHRTGYIFRLRSGGVTAYSECVTEEGPYYSYEDNTTAFHAIRSFLAGMLQDLPVPSLFLQRASAIKGHNMAKAALEMLLWDYHCRRGGAPLALRLGESKGYADVGVSIGMNGPETMVKNVTESIERGYRRIKLKVEKGREFEIVSAVRDAHPSVPLSIDANTDYTLKDAELLKRLDRFNLTYIEQPLAHDDLLDHAKLARLLSTPVCLDESITSAERAAQAFEIGACSVINIKPGRVAGLTESVRIAEVCRKSGGHCWVGGMLETGIGRSFNIALASLKNVDYPGDTSPNDRYFAKDVVRNPFSMRDGRIEAATGPGSGADVDEARLREIATEEGDVAISPRSTEGPEDDRAVSG